MRTYDRTKTRSNSSCSDSHHLQGTIVSIAVGVLPDFVLVLYKHASIVLRKQNGILCTCHFIMYLSFFGCCLFFILNDSNPACILNGERLVKGDGGSMCLFG